MNDLREYLYKYHLASVLECSIESIPGLPDEYPAYVFRDGKRFGVLILTDHLYKVHQDFAGTMITSESVTIDSEVHYCLMFSCSNMDYAYMFSFSEQLFIDPGVDGANRDKLLTSPQVWIEDFLSMYGNLEISKTTYDVIGELLLFEELWLKGKNPVWSGPKKSVVDVIADGIKYDSKSTTRRTESKIHISEQFQAEEIDIIAFYRFEELVTGELSLDSLTERMVSEGIDKSVLEQGISSLCIRDSRDLSKRYHLLEKRFYKNDGRFPKIVGEYFIDGVIPKGIESLEYVVDLTNLDFERVIPDIDLPRQDHVYLH